MRHSYVLALLLVLNWPLISHAQQPFERFGVKVKILTLTNGRYPEFFTNDSLRRISSVVYDTRLGRIAYLLPPDSLVGRLESEVTARWISPDPLAEKDAYITPYAFCRNNAVYYSDPDGREVIVKDKAQRAEIARLINERASGTFAFNHRGRLYLKDAGDGSQRSTYYTDRLVQAIDSKGKIKVDISETITYGKGDNKLVLNVDELSGGGTTRNEVGTKNSLVTISGNDHPTAGEDGKLIPNSPADILAHEFVGHAIPNAVGKDTGNAIENENKVRQEQAPPNNQPRQANPNHVE